MTEGGVKHALEKPWHGIRDVGKIKSAMRSIKEIGDNIKEKGQMVTLSQNGVVLVFRDNAIYTAFLEHRKGYFKDLTIGRFKKWVELLRSYFTELFMP